MSEMIGKEIEVIEASATTWKSIDGYYTFLKSDCEVVPDPTPQQTVKPNPFEILLKHQTKPFDGVRLSDNDKIIHAMTEYAELLSQLRVDEAVREIESKLKERKEWALNIRDNDESNMRIEEIDLALYYVTKK